MIDSKLNLEHLTLLKVMELHCPGGNKNGTEI